MKPISHSIASHNASSAWRVTRLHLPSHQAKLALQFKHWTAPDELTLRALSTLCHASLNFSSLMRIVHHLSLKLRAHFAPLCAPSIKTAPLARRSVKICKTAEICNCYYILSTSVGSKFLGVTVEGPNSHLWLIHLILWKHNCSGTLRHKLPVQT